MILLKAVVIFIGVMILNLLILWVLGLIKSLFFILYTEEKEKHPRNKQFKLFELIIVIIISSIAVLSYFGTDSWFLNFVMILSQGFAIKVLSMIERD